MCVCVCVCVGGVDHAQADGGLGSGTRPPVLRVGWLCVVVCVSVCVWGGGVCEYNSPGA